MHKLPLSPHDRLLHAVSHVTGVAQAAAAQLLTVPLAEPGLLREMIAEHLGDGRRVVVTGTLDRRLVLIENAVGEAWTAADLSGLSHDSRRWPEWTKDHLTFRKPQEWLSQAEITPEGCNRLLRPRLLLVSLYHPEYFPLPRFPLAISDLARAARSRCWVTWN